MLRLRFIKSEVERSQFWQFLANLQQGTLGVNSQNCNLYEYFVMNVSCEGVLMENLEACM